MLGVLACGSAAEEFRSQTLLHRTRHPWENGHNERFNGKLRDKLLNREILYTLKDPLDTDRAMETGIQHDQNAQRIYVSSTDPESNCSAI